MNTGSYLETLPLSSLAKYSGSKQKDGLPFTGYPQQHPTDKTRIIFIFNPLGETPTILEFRLEDILLVEELPQAVTEAGESIPLVKLWVRKGSRGVIMEPFEVNDTVNFVNKIGELQNRFPGEIKS
jgi:hypothetical protein